MASERSGSIPSKRCITWRNTRDNKAHMASPSVALLPVLIKVVSGGHMVVRVLALNVLRCLASDAVDEICLPMASSALGLLPLLANIVERHIDKDRTLALMILQTLSCCLENKVPMLSPELGLLDVLIKVLGSGDNENRTSALCVLYNLSNTASIRSLWATHHYDINVLRALKGVIEERGVDKADTDALDVLIYLSADVGNKVTSAGFLPLLINIVLHGKSDSRCLTLKVFQNLCITVPNEVSLSPDLGLLPALKKVLDEGSAEDKVRALEILRLLSDVISNQVSMSSPNFGLLPSLSKVVLECDKNQATSAFAYCINCLVLLVSTSSSHQLNLDCCVR